MIVLDGAVSQWNRAVVSSCAMGPASDRTAVVDAEGRVHGVAGLRVADASVMPVIPRANTMVPTVVVAERIAAGMLGAPSAVK